MKRRSFLGMVIGAAFAPLLPLKKSYSGTKIVTLYKVFKTQSGMEFVGVPWSKGGITKGESVRHRLLVPIDCPMSERGFFVETNTGLREIATDEHSASIIRQGWMPCGNPNLDEDGINALTQIWTFS